MNKRISILLFITYILCSASAQTVDTIDVYSQKMKKDIRNIVILPEGYETGETKYPVLYLLHGHGGRYDTWINRTKKSLPQEATRWQMIIVCPDGKNSWYWDSPIDPNLQYDTYVSLELTQYIDSIYNTIASPKGRAITGFSMGGHGGLWLGFNHPDVFGACGSMSGGVDIRPFPNNWNMKNSLGSYKENPAVWENHTVITQLEKIKSDSLAIIIDCGVDDFFYQVNENLHKEMIQRKIKHDYITRPGAHNHTYWNNALDYQMLFFSKFFNNK